MFYWKILKVSLQIPASRWGLDHILIDAGTNWSQTFL